MSLLLQYFFCKYLTDKQDWQFDENWLELTYFILKSNSQKCSNIVDGEEYNLAVVLCSLTRVGNIGVADKRDISMCMKKSKF